MERISRILAAVALAAALAVPALAEEPKKPAAPQPAAPQPAAPQMSKEQQAEMDAVMKAATPGKEHQHLASMAGTWDLVVRTMMPGQPPGESKGTSVREMILGGRVLVEKVHGDMAGMPFEGFGLSGFDNVSGRFWGNWQDNFGTGTMLSTGTCDAAWSCTFDSTYNDPVTKKAKKSRMTSRQEGPDKEVDEFFETGKDGKPVKTMEMVYTRHK